MPTTRTGDPTATQAPSSPPGPDVFPTELIPIDGEALTIESISQALKVCADFIAWQMRPRSIISNWADALRRYRNARLSTGFAVDHDGMPAGRILSFDENWNNNSGVITTVSTGRYGPWLYRIHGGTGASQISAAGAGLSLANVPWGPLVQLSPNSSHSSTMLLEYAVPLMLMSEGSFSMAFDFSITGASAPDASTSFAMGLGDGTLFANTSDVAFNTGGGPTPVGAAIYTNPGMTTVATYVCPPGGSPTNPALFTGLVRNAPHRIKMQIAGTDASDDGTGRVLFFVDGALGFDLPIDLVNAQLVPFIRMTTSGVEVCSLNVGPVQFRGRLALGDVVL